MEPWEEVDRALADAASAFDFQTLVAPADIEGEWERFDASGRDSPPSLDPPPLDLDLDRLRRDIEGLPLDSIEDREIHFILAGKRQELEWQLGMLQVRGRNAFMVRSMLHYGPVGTELLREARRILDEVSPGGGSGATMDAGDVKRRAREELERYRRQNPDFDAKLEKEEDQERLKASGGDLLVPSDIQLSPRRLEALVHHEVGTHVLTHYNGEQQPLQVLRNGVQDYDELQEALGVLAEFLDGGLTGTRLRMLAARVVAVHCVEDGAGFMDTFRTLDQLDIGTMMAFDTAASVHACGGFTRGQIYLRGLMWLLAYLASEGELEALYLGKMGPHQVPAVRRLRRRGFLRSPVLRPTFLEAEGAAEKLALLRAGVRPLQLVSDQSEDS